VKRIFKINISILFAFFFVALSINVSAQKNTVFTKIFYSKGQIVNLNGDTISGLIKHEFPLRFFTFKDKIMFIDTLNNKRLLYPKDILLFSIDESYTYLSIVEKKKDNFAQLLYDGEIKLLRRGCPLHLWQAFLSQKPILLTENYLLYNTSTKEIKGVNHYSFEDMSVYFSDNTELAARIKSTELGFEDILTIVELYNIWLEKK